jgi:hypothetical protein
MAENRLSCGLLPGWLFEDEGWYLAKLARKVPEDGAIVELGSALGRSTNFIRLGMPASAWLHCIDMWKDDVYFKEFQDKMHEFDEFFYDKSYNAYRCLTTEFPAKIKRWLGCEFDEFVIDLLFIDASHGYNDVSQDFNLYAPRVVKGGYIVFHDVENPNWPGIKQFIEKEVIPSGDYERVDKLYWLEVFRKR